MNKEDFLKQFNEPELLPYLDYINSKIRPSIDITLLDTPITALGQSRFGGKADLPEGTPWPTHPYGPYRFIGQINFSELTPPNNLLPPTGLLSLFFAFDKEDRTFWQDPDYVIGLYTPEGTPLKTQEIPDDLKDSHPETSLRIAFKNTFSIPQDRFHVNGDWPFEPRSDEDDAWYNIASEQHTTGAHLLGYPRNNCFSYDPAFEGKDIPVLITLRSFEQLNWCWHDGDRLVVFQDREKLINRDFSGLISDAG